MTATERGEWLDHAAACETCRAIANTLPTELPEAAPPTIGRFIPTREIGRGAMGVVYAAEDPELDRPIALKLLHDATDDERLHREARALAKLSHDNVVRVYDVGVDRDRVWVAMELVEGMTLRSWLASPHPTDEVLATLLRAGRGLAAAHAANIIHRDFKPDNVLIGTDRVVVGDFGLSRLGAHASGTVDDASLDVRAERLTRTGAMVGTPVYMAPEQMTGEATAASDQFAFCVTAWEALYGVRPFQGGTLRELRDAVLRGFFTRSERRIPRRVERALRRGLAGAPADRFGSMVELLAELAPPRRSRWIAATALVSIATAGGVAYGLAERPGDPCELGAAAIYEVWDAATRERIAATSPEIVAFLDGYARSWQTAKRAACTLPDSVSQRAARDFCFERARAELTRLLEASPAMSLATIRSWVVPVAMCEADVEVPRTPGFEVDYRSCGCPYSACDDDRVCQSECNARGYRRSGPVPGISVQGEQEAVVGASSDGDTLLYLSGGTECSLDRLLIARRRGAVYVPVDLTPQLVAHGLRIFEGCCTLAADARSVLVTRYKRPGMIRFPLLDGDRLGAPDDREFADLLQPDGTATEMIWQPVLSQDQRTLYFLRAETRGGLATKGAYEARRATIDQPFPAAERMLGWAAAYSSVSGVSSDGLSLFMTTEYSTVVLTRPDDGSVFADQNGGKPPRLPGWRAMPVDHCRRIVTTQSPGGCQQEQIEFLEAVGP